MVIFYRAVASTTLLMFAIAGLAAAPVEGAADEVPPLRHYVRQTWQTAEGLPQNSVRAIAQTPEGYLWFATAEGLVRFDGVRLTVFDRTSNPLLPGKNVDSLAVAADGSLWIGLRRQGVVRLAADSLTTWTTGQGLSGNDVLSMAAGPDGSVWVGTSGDGLSRIRGGAVTIYRREQGLPDNHVHALTVTRRGEVIVGTGAGSALVSDRGVERLIPEAARAAAPVGAVLEGDEGDVWIGTTSGLLRRRGGDVRSYGVADGLPSADIVALARGADRTIWIGMRTGGFARFRDGRFEAFTASDGLPDDFVQAVYEDRERNLWVGAAAGGVSRLRATPFRTISRREGLPAEVIRAVYESRDGSLWAGTHGYGLARIRDGQVTRWTMAEGLPSDGVSMIGESRDGAMWIGTREGLVRMQGRTLTRYDAKRGLPSENVRGFFEDRDGRVWIATVAGVCRIEGARCSAVAGLDVYVRGFHQAPDGALWMATTKGLWRYQDGTIRRWGKREGLSNEFLTSLAADPDGTLWLSSGGGGLTRFRNERLTSVGTSQGLHDDNIFRVLSDRGWIWMTSNRGLFRVSRDEIDAVSEGRARTVRSHVYTEVDGLPSSEFNGGSFPAGVVARDGRLWLPSVKGVAIVDPARFPVVAEPPAVHLERVMADGRPVGNGPADVGPGKGDLEFQYTAFRFAAPTRLRFRYRLEGFDGDWVDAGVRRAAFYTNLPPGAYVFRVQASLGDGGWGKSSAAFPITIRPRFHQTRLFLVGSTLAGLALAFAALRLRTARLRAQERRLREMVDERTRELREEVAERKRTERALVEAREAAIEASRLKSEFLANMSHEIRTPMNGVIGMTDLALDHSLEPAVREYLQTVRSSADSLLHVINDILDFAKIEAGKLELADADFDLRELVTDLVRLLGPRARDKGIRFECAIPADLPPRLVGDPLRLRQVLTNLVGNALKFTDQGEVRVDLGLVAASGAADRVGVRFAVVDSGIGIAERDLARIFDAFTQADGSSTRRFGGTGLGLSISSQLVRLMGGRLEVMSAPGHGSTFSFGIEFGRGAAPSLEPDRQAPTPSIAGVGRPLAVLVAEDNAVNQLVTARLLERAGHTASVVESGAAAIAALADRPFDVVLMDVQMPEMNGFEATRRIRDGEAGAGATSVPIIALTAHAMRGDRERCLAAGMDGYVSKPLRAPELYAALEHALGARDAA
jgi:signal transduction histidine kinase/ligand-binding sensor domain-containing protein/CheY-like chemotaxis protein